jgi:glycosyltransferase involved in cell wall biosynthesis
MTRKILVISNMYPTEEHKSFGIFVKNQVEALKERNLEVDVAAIRNPDSGKVNVLRKYFTWFLSTLLHLVSKGKSYDVIHAHYVFPSGALGLLFKKMFGTRLVVTAHGGDIDKMARKNERIFSWTKKILQEADEVIAVGEELYDTIVKEFNVKEDKLHLLNMGVNRHVFKGKDKMAARKETSIPGNVMSILYVGNIIEQKGLLELLSAINMLRAAKGDDYKVYLIGAAKDPSFKKVLDERIQENQLENVVEYVGVKTQREIAAWMSASDVFVLPSHIEGFGLVALEAMSCGTPVVGTGVGGLKYLLDQNTGTIVEQKNADSLYEGLEKTLHHAEYRKRIIENGLNKAKNNDQEVIIDKLMKIYFPTGG